MTWLAPEVAGELALAASPPLRLPVEAIALLSAVVEARSFRSLYGDRASSPRLWQGSLETFPPLDQIGGTGPDGRPTHTFGAWQWEPKTAGDIATGIGSPSVTPEDQIRGSWWLAQRDFKTHGGTDLITDLGAAGHDAAALDAIAARLHPTWPGGARPGFAARYLAALPGATPPTPGPTVIPPIPLGEQCILRIISATTAAGATVADIPSDLLKPDDPAICSASIVGLSLVIDSLAIGATTLRGAGQALPISVETPIVAHLELDLAHPVFAPIAKLARAVVLGAAAILPLTGMGNSTAIEPAPRAEPFVWERSPPTFRMMSDPADPLGQRLIVEMIRR